MSKHPTKVFYCDVETTGLDPKIHEIVQMGCIVEVNGEVVDELEFKMRPMPHKIKSITPEALRVQKRSLQQVLAFPQRALGYKAFIALLNKHIDKTLPQDKFIWIGQCPDFDAGFVREFMREFNNSMFDAYFDRRLVDLVALSMAMKMKGLLDVRSLKQEVVAEALGIEFGNEGAHDAMADIRVTRRILQEYLSWIEGPRRFGKQLELV